MDFTEPAVNAKLKIRIWAGHLSPFLPATGAYGRGAMAVGLNFSICPSSVLPHMTALCFLLYWVESRWSPMIFVDFGAPYAGKENP